MNERILIQSGIDYEKGVHRFMNDREFYNNVLKQFIARDSITCINEALARGDVEAIMSGVHDLKGVSGNLEITDVYSESSDIVSLIRSKQYTMDALQAMCARLAAAYNKAAEGIRRAMEED